MNRFEMNTSLVEVFTSYKGGYGIIPRVSMTRIKALNRFLGQYSELEPTAEPVFFCNHDQIEKCLQILKIDAKLIADKKRG